MSVKSQKQTLGFQTEVKQLLHLLAHSLYSNKEIFLRELVSNAADAADKLRYEALQDKKLFEEDPDLKIWVSFDEKARTLTIRDNGIGMSREELIQNIGTIAKSGTREFLQKLPKDQSEASNMIGQFGVGFYSSFVVADKVTVKTRRAGLDANHGVFWESQGEGEYVIENIERAERGTEIVLHLREGEDEFLDDYRLRDIIKRYSDHIPVPVMMTAQPFDLPEGEEEKEAEVEAPKEEVVNQAQALWMLPKNEVTEEQYTDLYKHISHDFQGPLTWSHNRVEGRLEYTSLLYIPQEAPFDLMNNRDQQHGLKLYVKRVFIMDEVKQLMPAYLRFVRGVIDSSDLPLNVSRELLQDSQIIASIKSGCVKRVLSMLETLAEEEPEKYATFWKHFGAVMKEGPGEDFGNKDRLAKLLRFATTAQDSVEQTVSLADYVARMKPDQDKIYYITAETFTAAKNSPHLEIFRKKGVEVLLLFDRIDEWMVAHLTEFDGKPLQSVTKGDLDMGEPEDEKEKEEQKAVESDFESVIKQIKKVLVDQVKEVRITHRLTDSPACLVADDHEMSAHLQRMLKDAGQSAFPGSKPIFEVNPSHPLVVRLKGEQDEDKFADWAQTLFDQALIAEGGRLEDPASFVKRLNKLMLDLT